MQADQSNNQQRTIWMENAGFLYDRLMVHKLKWPALSFQWLPGKTHSHDSTIYQCIYSTHSSGQAQAQHLYIAQVTFPTLRSLVDTPTQIAPSQIKNIAKFTHELQINKARYCPNQPSMIAARTDQGPITIFQHGTQYPIHLLQGNLNGGFALQWSSFGILSGDFEGNAYYWHDPTQSPATFNYQSPIQDIKIVQEGTAAIVGDQGCLSILDMRQGRVVQHTQVSTGQKKQVYCVSVNPEQRQLVITGGQDEIIRLWDRRNLSVQLHKFEDHADSVMSLQWSQTNRSVFASGSADRKVKIWDLMRVGFEIPKDLGGTDQLLFTHEGHKEAVNDISWHPEQELVGSVSQDNTLQFYQMTNNIHELEYAQDLQYLREQCFS